jgi:hypothetical protein
MPARGLIDVIDVIDHAWRPIDALYSSADSCAALSAPPPWIWQSPFGLPVSRLFGRASAAVPGDKSAGVGEKELRRSPDRRHLPKFQVIAVTATFHYYCIVERFVLRSPQNIEMRSHAPAIAGE